MRRRCFDTGWRCRRRRYFDIEESEWARKFTGYQSSALPIDGYQAGCQANVQTAWHPIERDNDLGEAGSRGESDFPRENLHDLRQRWSTHASLGLSHTTTTGKLCPRRCGVERLVASFSVYRDVIVRESFWYCSFCRICWWKPGGNRGRRPGDLQRRKGRILERRKSHCIIYQILSTSLIDRSPGLNRRGFINLDQSHWHCNLLIFSLN